MQDPELVNQLKERLPEALFEKLNNSLSIDRDRLKFAEYKVRVLEERLRLVRIEKYGPGSEKLSDAQLELLELEPGVSSAEVKVESERGQLQLPLRNARKHPGRQELPAHLPRVEKIIACTPPQSFSIIWPQPVLTIRMLKDPIPGVTLDAEIIRNRGMTEIRR